MNIANVLKLKGREVTTVHPQVTLETAAVMLTERGIGSLVVVDFGGKPVGILSERDIVRAVAAGGAAALQQTVESSMSRPVVICREADTIDEVMGQMTARRFRHLPVLENDKLVGIVSIGDVVKHRIAETEMEAAAMRAYITTG
ncbi:MAG: CBS domain-containing protein [Hyphomicrobiaceae bacterium]